MTLKNIKSAFLRYSVSVHAVLERHVLSVGLILFCIAFVDLSIVDAQAYSGEKFKMICKNILDTLDGNFASLLTATAGLGAIISSAAGGFRMAWSLVVVAIGSFTLRTYQEIWFASCGG